MFNCDFSNEVIQSIKQIIEEKNQCSLNIQKTFSTYWLRDFAANELRISRLQDFEIIISRVEFENKRAGTMTEVMKVLTNYCQKEHIGQICVQSVATYEMMQFCMKNKIKPKQENIWINDILAGDYVLEIK